MIFINYGLSFFGSILIIVGIIALLTNLGVIGSAIWDWWPILLVILGIYVLVLKKQKKKIIAGHFLRKITSDDKIQEKIKKILETVNAVVDKKIDEWHDEATKKSSSRK